MWKRIWRCLTFSAVPLHRGGTSDREFNPCGQRAPDGGSGEVEAIVATGIIQEKGGVILVGG